MKSYRPHPGADTLNFRDASIGLGPGGVAPQKSQKFEIQKISETAYKPGQIIMSSSVLQKLLNLGAMKSYRDEKNSHDHDFSRRID